MIIDANEYFPTLKKIFAWRPKKCFKCNNYFQYERVWRAETLPYIGQNLYTIYFLCTGCANKRKDAVKAFVELTATEAQKMA